MRTFLVAPEDSAAGSPSPARPRQSLARLIAGRPARFAPSPAGTSRAPLLPALVFPGDVTSDLAPLGIPCPSTSTPRRCACARKLLLACAAPSPDPARRSSTCASAHRPALAYRRWTPLPSRERTFVAYGDGAKFKAAKPSPPQRAHASALERGAKPLSHLCRPHYELLRFCSSCSPSFLLLDLVFHTSTWSA